MVVASLFGDLAKAQNLQTLIDDQLTLLYGKSIWRQHLDWGIPQIDLSFATAIGRSRIEAAASLVDPDSDAPLRSRGALEKLEGKIPTMKEMFVLNQDDYRKLKQLSSLPISDNERTQILIKKLWNDMENAATSTDKRIDIMFLQGISNFAIDVNVLNNPDGVAFGNVDLLAKPEQKRTVVRAWTDPLADPFSDIRDVVRFAGDSGRVFSDIWIDQTLWYKIQNLAAVKQAISGYQNPGSNAKFIVTLERVNEYLTANGWPVMKVLNYRTAVEKDGKPFIMNPFNDKNVVFKPAGKLGIVHNALSVDDMERVQGITYAKYDRTLVSKWRDNSPWKEYTQAELNAFPALEQIDGIFLLQTDVITV